MEEKTERRRKDFVNVAINPRKHTFRPLSVLLLNHVWFADELTRRGHRVITVGWDRDDFHLKLRQAGITIQQVLEKLPRGFEVDRVVYFDDSRPLGLSGLEDLKVPTIFYSVDAHHHVGWHKHLACAFDQVLVAQKCYVHEFETLHPNVTWFPLWATRIFSPVEPKTVDVSFRGTLSPKLHSDRTAFFERLSQYVTVDAGEGPYEDLYARSKIVVNEAVRDDLNFRVFEAMMGGALLITPSDSTGLRELFEDGRDLITYERGNERDAAEKIKYYLQHDHERQEIAARGHEKVMAKHIETSRADELERYLYEVAPINRTHKYYHVAMAFLSTTKLCLQTENETLARTFVKKVREQLMKSANAKEVDSKDFQAMVFRCRLMLQKLGQEHEALGLLEAMHQTYPENSIFAVGMLHELLLAGRNEEATQLARAISSKPEELMLNTPAVIQAVHEEIHRHD